jgi:hypothetical protein
VVATSVVVGAAVVGLVEEAATLEVAADAVVATALVATPVVAAADVVGVLLSSSPPHAAATIPTAAVTARTRHHRFRFMQAPSPTRQRAM